MPSPILAFCAIAILNLLFTNYVNGRDLYLSKTITSDLANADQVIECEKSEDLDVLCQRCAKKTKLTNIYEMCCNNKEALTEWCDRYLRYGSLA